MIRCVVCQKEVLDELVQDFHDECMNNFIDNMQELKSTNPEEYNQLKKEFYSKD